MPKLFVCITVDDVSLARHSLLAVAREFSFAIEVIEDGIVFDASGLERLIGSPERVARRVQDELDAKGVEGSVALADTTDAAMLLARSRRNKVTVNSRENFTSLSLNGLDIERDTLNVFDDLGVRNIGELLAIPRDELSRRYGRDFDRVIKRIEQRGERLLTPNIRESRVAWSFDLDQAVEDFEQLIFILNHGLERLFARVANYGKSSDHIDITLRLADRSRHRYEIKASFPTLDRGFWLKLINLRVSLEPPAAAISAVEVITHFTKPRPDQRGLYAVSKPEPESLLLTAGKLKKLVGKYDVGTPVLLNERVALPFRLDADALPVGKEKCAEDTPRPVIAFTYFRPARRAEVEIRDRKITYVRTREFAGPVIEHGGVWRAASKWWTSDGWKTQEWDVEVENAGVYRLALANGEWLVVGEYD
ncbi:MAG: hypothetical protein KF756_12970 [Acidobacteria bacterium]|nr:hypothetical protein [Acidobacteriota bacterium]